MEAMSNKPSLDLILVGGGLANCMIAYGLKKFRPDVNFIIIEAGSKLWGNHTWSFHTHDLTPSQFKWIEPLILISWPFKNVHFPTFTRKLESGYHTVTSEKIRSSLSSLLKADQIKLNSSVSKINLSSVELKDGEILFAKSILDGRGWNSNKSIPHGYQKFVGMDLTLTAPHGLKGVTLMDATREQKDGYRYFYVLPWSENTLLIEDIHYSNNPEIREDDCLQAIVQYAQSKNWSIESVQRVERGCLSMPLSLPSFRANTVGVLGGFFHFSTGYSFHESVRVAEALIQLKTYTSQNIQKTISTLRNKTTQNSHFLLFLNRMIFLGTEGNETRTIFERFYKLPQAIIQRFFSGDIQFLDAFRVLAGKPPFPLLKVFNQLPSPHKKNARLNQT